MRRARYISFAQITSAIRIEIFIATFASREEFSRLFSTLWRSKYEIEPWLICLMVLMFSTKQIAV